MKTEREKMLARQLYDPLDDELVAVSGARALPGAQLERGKRVFFNFNCVMLDVCPVRISPYRSAPAAW